MAAVIANVTDIALRLRDKFFEKLASYTLDRLVWCLAAIGLCWCEVQNYHEYIFLQKMYIMVGVGAFYCWKLGCFSKEKRIWCGVATSVGAIFTGYTVITNLYDTYYYLNWPIGLLTTVTLNLYLLVIYDCVKDRRFPFSMNPSMVLILMVVAQQFSVYDYRQYYLYMLLGLLPYIMMKKGLRTRSCMLNGIIDGMCIGFFLVQGYAWMHRPYNFSALRYTAFSNNKTTAARIYLTYFVVWITRYVQLANRKPDKWNVLRRIFSWFMAAFVLALVYLTGSRSTVLAIMAITAIAVAIRYYQPKDKWYKRLGKFGLWLTNCICVGLMSLTLFSPAYASVRYLPAYFDEPDYYDSIGYRLRSRPIQKWGENFGWDFEYDEFAVKEGDGIDNPLYASFEEAAIYNIGRIIPGTEEYLGSRFSAGLKQKGLERIKYYFEQGYWIEQYYIQWSEYYENLYVDVEQEESMKNDSSLKAIYKRCIQKILDIFIITLNADGIADNSELSDMVLARGDSAENPWFEESEFPGYGMALRAAIHEYTVSKLNMTGHPDGSFEMWVTESDKQPHAHNIFLISGYDFGIPTMLLAAVLLIVTFIACGYNVIRYGKDEYLFPALLIAGMTIFGMFETGFDYKSGMYVWIVLCIIFSDVIYRKRRKGESKRWDI